jgi:glycerol-3-phosphate O-acyltransferase
VIAAALAILQAAGISATPAVEAVSPQQFPEHAKTIERLRGFRRLVDGVADPVIYIVKTTDTYRAAAAGDLAASALVASTILHEMTHGQIDGDEDHALTEETRFLRTFIQSRLVWVDRSAPAPVSSDG